LVTAPRPKIRRVSSNAYGDDTALTIVAAFIRLPPTGAARRVGFGHDHPPFLFVVGATLRFATKVIAPRWQSMISHRRAHAGYFRMGRGFGR
jgi:hypothetical protein